MSIKQRRKKERQRTALRERITKDTEKEREGRENRGTTRRVERRRNTKKQVGRDNGAEDTIKTAPASNLGGGKKRRKKKRDGLRKE